MRLVSFSLFLLSSAFSYQFTGEVSLENRVYQHEGRYGNTDQSEISVSIKPNFSYAWDQDRKVINVVPFYRKSSPDEDRTHFDLREASFVGAYGPLEIRAGISKVYWGVTESVHLVDTINQTDNLENIDGEEKLGQPMITPSWVSDYGTFTLYVLPYFRERSFAGGKGRLRSSILIDEKNPIYQHEDEQRHIDFAGRWSHYLGNLEWGLSTFKGTKRDPNFVYDTSTGLYRPEYVLSERYSLDAQYIWDDLLIKFEGVREDPSLSKTYHSFVSGVEYTFSNIWDGKDIGLLYEYIYDERDYLSPSGQFDHSFVGNRMTFNDELGTQILAGAIYSHGAGNLEAFRVEASRRITNTIQWEFELQSFLDISRRSSLYQIRSDDFVTLRINKFW